jgi:hypothetical protein
MTNIILSAATFTIILLLYGAFRIWRRDGMGKQPALMIFVAVIMMANVAIWTIPDGNGNSLVKNSNERR